MKNYESKYFKIEVDNRGIIRHEPETTIHFQIGCMVANNLQESGTAEWYNVCLAVMDAIVDASEQMKSTIATQISYSFNLFPKSLEESHKQGQPFNEAKAYVAGYTDAANEFRKVFDQINDNVIYTLDTFLPGFQQKTE